MRSQRHKTRRKRVVQKQSAKTGRTGGCRLSRRKSRSETEDRGKNQTVLGVLAHRLQSRSSDENAKTGRRHCFDRCSGDGLKIWGLRLFRVWGVALPNRRKLRQGNRERGPNSIGPAV